MMYLRGNTRDYDFWHEHGLKGWSYVEVYSHDSNTLHRLADEITGVFPEWRVRQGELRWIST